METKPKLNLFGLDFSNVVDVIIKLGALYLLLGYCLDILRPFVIILIWGGIIAIATHPVFIWFKKLLRGRTVLGSVTVTLLMLAILIVPSWLIVESMLEGIDFLKSQYVQGHLHIPPPGETVKNWPAFLGPLVKLWEKASVNLESVLAEYSEQIRNIALWMFSSLSGFGSGLLQFIASIIVAGVLFVYSVPIHKSSVRIFSRLAGSHGEGFAAVSVATIRNVVKGILGVAFIQAGMAGIGFFIGGIPFAGLWTILSLILAIVQIGAGPVIIPVIIYAFSTSSILSASFLCAWLLIAMFIDNFLKPVLLGRGAPAPMLVIFLGAIGGFISHGFIGLFMGAVILTLGYKLFDTWLNMDE
ncbi:MAG TPA: AI-2E family transporter [Bacteroidia bacterium]|nr:AI-2E family transporter [Bacteroidia bacterium]